MQTAERTLKDHSRDLTISRGPVDVPFLMLTLLLLGVGVVMVLSASYASAYYDLSKETGGNATYYFTRQLVFALVGVAVMLAASRVPLKLYSRFSLWVLGAAVVLLAAVLVIGSAGGGGTRWILVGGISIQPSEIAKIGVILSFATLICRYGNLMGTFKYGVAPFAAILGVIVVLLFLEPHLSASIIIILVGAVMLFIGGARLFWFIGGLAGVGGLFLVAITVLQYSSERISAWLDPFGDPSDTGYQIVQSLYAIGSGGLFGLGLGQSRQKYLYLPEEHNDFIFSIISEELGFVGAGLILLIFALLVVRGYWIAMHSRDRYSFLVCTGITSLLALQVILNVAVCTNLVPCTGISLPFFSYGGSALLVQLGEAGIILSVSRDIPVTRAVKKRRPESVKSKQTLSEPS
ncbi:MAG: putative lipid II flippase FtsW [Oscillospiraceae bacterium]|nr:putative lipid II flippase FtsW [Oscillospiraceae bacterium]